MSIEVNKEALAALSVADLIALKNELGNKYHNGTTSEDEGRLFAIMLELNKKLDNLFIS